ncbi:MAG: hypothetical protein JO029_00515 [Candidatus Eremiobacteraeota bacterium]|nr:hypothetical protein [Candidatus Eremiobacteraeota bacterium]
MILSAAFLATVLAQVQPSPFPSASPPATPSGPVLTLSATSLSLNPAQQRSIAVSGASPPLGISLDRKLVSATVDPSNASVTVTATQATGDDVLHISDANGATADVAIRVAFNAGTIVPEATLRVTGSPADPAWLAAQVAALVARLTQAMPNAQIQIAHVAPPIAPLAPGAVTQFSVPVGVTGPDGAYFDQNGSTTVNVSNVPLDPFAPPLLLYDDDPEHVAVDGVLFRHTIDSAQPVRLYYYHDAVAGPRRLVVVLSNASPNPASVQVIDATAGPNEDVMHVGDAATRQFLVGKARNQGVILDLAQDQPLFLHDIGMNAGQLVAGTVDLRVLSGGPVGVTVLAVSPGIDPRTLLDGPMLPGDGHHRTGTFRIDAYGNERLDYVTGSTDPAVVIGDRDPTPPSVDPAAAGHDYGDYGVTHNIDVTMQNAGDAPATAYVYFKPLAGVARASFLVDGNAVELGCMRVPQPYQIASYAIPPRQTIRAFVQTMTDGGSFYPAEVGVTATPPQPSAPPIAAPDGCFPKPVPASTEAPSASPSPSSTP